MQGQCLGRIALHFFIFMNNLILTDADNQKLVDSRIIAKALGVEHASTYRLITKYRKNLEVDGHLRFEIETVKNSAGASNKVKYTLLNEQQALFIGTLSSNTEKAVEFKQALSRAYQSIKNQLPSYQIDDKVQRATRWIEEQKEYIALDAKAKENAPKVEFYDKVAEAKNTIEMTAVAKIIGTGRNKLFLILRELKVLRYNNEPYQEYIDMGWFEIKVQVFQDGNGNSKIYNKTMVTPKGVQMIDRLTQSKSIVTDSTIL